MTAREIIAKLRKGEVYHIKKELFEKFKEEIVKHNLLDLNEKSIERLRVQETAYYVDVIII